MNPKRILVVGGGSAGWTAAAYLNAALNVGNRKAAHVALVESPEVPRIGVGEATVPNINRTLAMIGIDELEFMKAVDATFKASIRFVNWLDGKRRFYHHPFSRFGAGLRDDAGRRWLMSDRSVPYMNTVSAQPVLCELGLAPKAFDQPDLGIPVGYAFHMNALKYADYLRDFSTARGVTHHLEHVTDIETGRGRQDRGARHPRRTAPGSRPVHRLHGLCRHPDREDPGCSAGSTSPRGCSATAPW